MPGVVGFCFKSQPGDVELIDKEVDDACLVVFGDKIIETIWEQGGLKTILAFNKATHRLLSKSENQIISPMGVFTQSGPNVDILGTRKGENLRNQEPADALTLLTTTTRGVL